MIRTTFRIAAILALALMLGACGLVYKQNIQQGNVLESEDIEQLDHGMTKRQVLVLLGSPSVQSPFHADRWDYVSTFARRGRDPEKRYLTLEFEDERLIAFHGDYLEDGEIEDATIDAAPIEDPEDLEPFTPIERPSEPDPNSPIPPPDQ